jgi:hypothetical protein
MRLSDIILAEGTEVVGDPPYRVFRNPTSNALIAIAKRSRDRILKGLYEPSTGALYVWDAYHASHATVEYDLGLPYAGKGFDVVSFILGLNEDGKLALHVCDDRADAQVRSHPSLRPIEFVAPDSALKSRWR